MNDVEEIANLLVLIQIGDLLSRQLAGNRIAVLLFERDAKIAQLEAEVRATASPKPSLRLYLGQALEGQEVAK